MERETEIERERERERVIQPSITRRTNQVNEAVLLAAADYRSSSSSAAQ